MVRTAGLPGSKAISAKSYLLSFLTLELLGTERYAHVGDHAFDPGLGLFAGLNILPKCTAMSTYAYSLDEMHLRRLQQAFVRQATGLGLYDGSIVNSARQGHEGSPVPVHPGLRLCSVHLSLPCSG